MAEQYVNEDGSGRTRTIIIPDDVEFEGQGVVEAFPDQSEAAPEPGDGTGPFGGGAPSDGGGADSAANTEAEEAGNSGDESAG